MKIREGIFVILCVGVIMTVGCSKQTKESMGNTGNDRQNIINIGISFDSFVIERWQRDRDIFVATAKELGADVNVQNANGVVEEQISQIEYFMDKKMDVIVIIAVDAEKITDAIKKAKDAGIKVVAYDRLIKNADADLYISFDNEEVGRLMARTLVENTKSGGNIITIFGPTTDNNVNQVESGFNEIIKDSGINIIYKEYAKGWTAERGFYGVNEGLKLSQNIDGVLCGNDDIASQAVRALSENRLAGKVCVVGQDADLAACQRIVEGTQTMTVYKPVEKLAKAAAEYAVKLAKGETIETKSTIKDGTYEINYIKLEPIAVTKENMDEVIIDGGFHIREDVYLNVQGE